MQNRTDDDVVTRVAALVGRVMANQSPTAPIGYEDDLRNAGLSSLGLVNLMLAVETEFDLKVPERDMRPANFRSIARIAALVHELSVRPAATA